MRRICATRCALGIRSVYSAMLANYPVSKEYLAIGKAATIEDAAKARLMPVSILEHAFTRSTIDFTIMEIARAKYAPIIATITEKDDLRLIAGKVREQKGTSAESLKAVTGAKEKFTSTKWKSVKELMTYYEEVMYPIRCMKEKYDSRELDSFHIKDDLKRGLSAFKQDHLDKQKLELEKVKAEMKECQNFIAEASKAAFTTAICNDIANILRVGGEKFEHSRRMALQVLEDMNLLGVPFDAVTNKLLHSVVFQDGPHEDSALLFNMIEFPERGEVSIAKKSLEEVSDDILKIISNRHQTPLDNNRLIHQNDTHPCLQRSPE